MSTAGEVALESIQKNLDELLQNHGGIKDNLSRAELIEEAVNNKEATPSACGSLSIWTAPESTGRSPEDTVFVKRSGSADVVDWESVNNLPIDPETFDMVLEDALKTLSGKEKLYISDRSLGADPAYALPIKVLSAKALNSLFIDNMFRGLPEGIEKSILADKGFTLLALPDDKLDPKRYEGKLRVDPTLGHTSTMVVGLDFDRRIGVVYGSAYCGSMKKMMFTAMNYLLPQAGILSLHASANEGKDGHTALLLGLSGTGKTTLSAHPGRLLLGDDEHGWSDTGIANFENGCYAKLINLSAEKEPDIYKACFHEEDWHTHGAIIENAFMYPTGEYDLNDARLTSNSRGSFLLSAIDDVKEPPVGGHPNTILFLTADANGVLPPVAKLTRDQAMFWFLMGYTSKLAGTERGVKDPVSTFSRFFGQPFMPLHPSFYIDLLGKKLDQHGTQVYLVNTGWSGGPYGVGKRMDIVLTRTIVDAALTGALQDAPTVEDTLFHLAIPTSCPGVEDASVLVPKNTWADKAGYDKRAKMMAKDFSDFFDKNYANKNLDAGIVASCPGK